MRPAMACAWAVLLVVTCFMSFPADAQSPNPQETLNRYLADLQKSPGDLALRERIITFGQTMKPSPAIPEDAERYMARGAAAVKGAKSVEDFREAAAEFEKATSAVPWLPEAYYNLGVAQDKAGLYDAAIKSLKLLSSANSLSVPHSIL